MNPITVFKKIKLLSFVFLCAFILQGKGAVFAQSIDSLLQAEDTTFYQVYDRLHNFYSSQDSLIENDSIIDDNHEHRFYKWAEFWQNRLDSNALVGDGANVFIQDFLDNDLDFCQTTNDDHINWRGLGPFNSDGSVNATDAGTKKCSDFLPGSQNQGMIGSVSVHPDSSDVILAGAANGGIWRTDDGGDTWSNTTDDEGYSIIGVNRLVRHPDEPDIIYASTKGGFGLWGLGESGYAIGLIVSDDGGRSWEPTDFNPDYV